MTDMQSMQTNIGGGGGSQSNIIMAIIGGAVAAVVGAAIWAAIAYLTGYEIGWIAIGVGALVGIAVRVMGRGDTPPFGVLAALLSLGGCVLGRLMAIWLIFSNEYNVPLGQAIENIPVIDALKQTASPIDAVFLIIALVVGYQVAVSREEAPAGDRPAEPQHPPQS
jgi:hypothetical protein